jgi:hypothetical protein
LVAAKALLKTLLQAQGQEAACSATGRHPMTVTVYVWRFRKLGLIGFGNVGHSSIKILRQQSVGPDEEVYFSWWPGGDDADRKGKKLRHTTSHFRSVAYGAKAKAAALDTIEDAAVRANQRSDKEAEERSADAKYRFNLNGAKLLSEFRMMAACRTLHQGTQVVTANGHAKGGEYSLVHQNCSDVVAFILEQGGAANIVPKPPMRFYWTPTDVAKWCDKLTVAMNKRQEGSAARTRGFTGNDMAFTQHEWRYSALATSS